MTVQQDTLFALERRRFIQICGGSLAIAAGGCGRRQDFGKSRRSTVIVAVPELPTFDNWLVFLPLMALNEQGDFEGRLAERWSHSPDYREWTYYLRPGIRWQDGVPVSAHDVKFSLDLLAHPDVLEISPAQIESVTVLNDQTVRVRHRRATEYSVDQVLYPKHLLEHLSPSKFYDWDFWKRPVGNGPYRFVRQVPHTMIEFEANPDYYRRRPKITNVVLKSVGWGRTGFADLLAGNVDARTFVNFEWVPTLAADARFRIYHWYGMTMGAIYWQHRHPLFQDPRMRRALTLAIDRRELMQVLNLPQDAPLTDGPYKARQLRRGELGEPLPHDPPQARELLEAAGWHERPGSGVRERDGLTFRFNALVSSDPNFYPTALYVQAQLRRVGVEMVIQLHDEDVAGIIRRGEFREAAFHHFSNSTLFELLGTSSLGYRSARVTALLNRVRDNVDPDVEDRIYGELREIFREDVPVTDLFPTTAFSLAHRRIRGLRSPYRADVLRDMDELWLDDRGRGGPGEIQ